MCLQMPDARPTIRATRANMLSGAADLPPAEYSQELGNKGQPFSKSTDIMFRFHKEILAKRAQAAVCAMEQGQTASLNPQAGIGLAPGNEAVIVGMAASLAQAQPKKDASPDSDSDVDSGSILPVGGTARWARSRSAATKKKAGSKPAVAAAKKKAAAAAKRKAAAAAKKVADKAARVRGREARSRAEKQISSAMMAQIAEQRANGSKQLGLAEPGEKQASLTLEDSDYDSADSEDEYGELEEGVTLHAYSDGTARPDMAQKLAEVKVELGARLTSDSVESFLAEKRAVLCVYRNCRKLAVGGPHCATHVLKKKRSAAQVRHTEISRTGPTAPRLALALPALP